MTFWTMLCPNDLGTPFIFLHMCLILFPGSIVRSGLHSSLFFTVSRMWFLLVRLACMAVSTGLWHRLNNSPSRVCLSLFHLREVAKPMPWPRFHFTLQKRPVPGSSGASLAKRPHLESGTGTCPGGKKSAGGSASASSADTRRKRTIGVSTPDVLQFSAFSSSSSVVFEVGMLY